MRNTIDSILKPRSVAVIGASSKPHTIGSDLMCRLVEYGFTGDIYPVNPKGGEIAGLTAYPSVADIPGEVDLAIVMVNHRFVLDIVDQCHQKGIQGLVIISAGFKETGPEGAQLEKDLNDRLEAYGMRAIGPNCLGVVNTHPSIRLDATFAEELPVRGDIGFVSQSGALGGGILNILKDLNLGFAQFVSIGNQANFNAEDAMYYWEKDEDVKQILLYMESISNPVNFRQLATRISKKKPILALKAGRSAAGASAASSHTGSLVGADKAADALLKQSGVIREFSLQKLFSTAKIFSNAPLPKGDRIAIVTNSGGPGIMATDAICEYGMQRAPLSEATKDELRSFLPPAASVKNPVDMIASAPLEHYRRTLETVLADDNVDMVVVIYLPFLGLKDIDVTKEIMRIKNEHPDKPIVGVFMTKSDFFEQLSELEVNIPIYMYAEEAIDAMNRLNQQRLWVNTPAGKIPSYKVDKVKAKALMKNALKAGRDQLTTRESLDLLEAYGIRVSQAGFATSLEEALAEARRIGFPIVMKMSSKTTSHKTDVGGVRVNIKNEAELTAQYNDLMDQLKRRDLLDGLEGVVIQEMVKSSREMVCGIATDPQYGPMLMFGLGGVFVEVLKDVSFRLAPLTDIDAKAMVNGIKARHLLDGVRGMAPANVEKIEETLMRLSALVSDFPFVDELDINPLMVTDATGEAIAVDGRLKFRMDEARLALDK